MKEFYRDQVGLRVEYETPTWVEFDSAPGFARLGLLSVRSSAKKEIELCFETKDIAAAAESRNRRGVTFVDNVREQAFGKVIHSRDPEGNLLTMLQAKPREARVPGASWGSSGRGVAAAAAAAAAEAMQEAGGTATATAVVQNAPVLSTAVINCTSMKTTRAFYKDGWGLKLKTDSSWWVEFETGDTVIALHPRIDVPDREHHHGQSVTLGFNTPELSRWVGEASERGLHFANSLIDEGFGLYTEVADPDGNLILFREGPAPLQTADLIAAKFADAPQQEAIRKPVRKGVGASRLVAKTPRTAKQTATPKSKTTTKRLPSTRGAGPEGTRLAPKRKVDPKRVRNRPGVGRLKKAERKTIKVHKRSVASASKSRPVKRAVAGRRK